MWLPIDALSHRVGGWLVVAVSCWLNPCATIVCGSDARCMLTQDDVSSLRFVVQGDDMHLYDAMALRTWARWCKATSRPCVCVIPSQPITRIRPVVVSELPPPPAAPETVAPFAPIVRKMRRPPPRIPSASGSAFVPFRRVR